jgi:hypothetical protein
MSSEIVLRGKERIYYANVTYMGIRLRDRLKTVNRDEVQRRLIELNLLRKFAFWCKRYGKNYFFRIIIN